MVAGTTGDLLALLGLSQSFSRPRTSDDNPFSEAQFRTAKYHWTMPPFFATKEAAISHFDQFFTWYNESHMHSGLNLLTPGMVQRGLIEEVVARRQGVMNEAWRAHPERFSHGRPEVRRNPAVVGINLRMKAVKVGENGTITAAEPCASEALSLH